MKVLTSTVARVLFALPFGVFGINHFVNAEILAGLVPIPGGVFWVYLTGVAHILACIALLAKQQVRLAMLLFGLMLLIFALSVQLPGVLGDGGMSAMSNLLKDLSLAGAAWYIAGQAEEESMDMPDV